MNRNNSDRFEISKQNPFEEKDNFFLMDDPLEPKMVSSRRLNDYDFNLLKEDAYKDVSDDLFKLEYKISKIEDEIKSYDAQILSAKEIHDYELVGTLTARRRIAQEDYDALVEVYNEKSLSAKISDGISMKFKSGFNGIKSGVDTIIENIASKLPKRFSSVFELRKSLAKLENISKSVDELVNLNIPYGEQIDKYEQLSKYIIKANSIQNEISRFIK